MGLRNGEALNALCPGLNGPSDIDHVLHNGHVVPERVVFIEYKSNGARLSGGQARLLRGLKGDWHDEATGRRLAVRYIVLPLAPDNPSAAVLPIVEWLWPEQVTKAS